MASGIEMMFKAMGIDVQQIQEQFGGQLQKFQQAAETVIARLDAIDAKLAELDRKLDQSAGSSDAPPILIDHEKRGEYGQEYERNGHG